MKGIEIHAAKLGKKYKSMTTQFSGNQITFDLGFADIDAVVVLRLIGEGELAFKTLEADINYDISVTGGRPKMKDNWIHRSEGMRCKTCMYFVIKESSSDTLNEKGEMGRCRRHSPTMSGFPVVFESDWCGDHKLDEEKI